MKTLDRSRPFGEICGTPTVHGARFEQDGFMFDSAGVAIGHDEPEIKPETQSEPLVIHRLPEPHDVDDEAIASAMIADGKSKREIVSATGLHHKTVEKMIRDAEADTDITLG